jgi:hypothetical protein
MSQDSTLYNIETYLTDSVSYPQETQIEIVPAPAKIDFVGENRQDGYPASVTLLILSGFVLLAFIKYNYAENLVNKFKLLFNYRRTMRMIEERRESDRLSAVLLNILFSFSVGIFITIIFPELRQKLFWGSYTISIMSFTIFISLIYLLKTTIWKLLGVIFLLQPFSRIYVQNMLMFNNITGIVVFPLIALIPFLDSHFTDYLIYVIIALFVTSYLLRLFRLFRIINEQNVQLYHFILYLCSLEILPLFLIMKSCNILINSIVV